jgi:hypothetical protein
MPHPPAVETPIADPLQYGVPLPHSVVLYPLGYPVRIETNSMDVVRAADEIWGRFPCLRQTPPVQVRLIIAGSGRPAERAAPNYRGQGHLVACTIGPDDYAVADVAGGFVFGWLTPASLSDRGWFRYHILEPLVYLTLQSLYCLPVHGAAVARNGHALLLCGNSGAGKTCLAYACARRGWTYLADDATMIHRDRTDLIATGHPHQVRFRSSASSLFPELAQFPPVVRPSGKPDIEVDSALLGLSTALEAPVAGLVFVKREPSSSPASLHPYTQSDALNYLEQVICFGDDRARSEMRHCAWRLVELPAVELRYGDFDDAGERLREFMDGCL